MTAAMAKSAPPDYVVVALLATSASLIANVRWGSPWQSRRESTILWAMNIGTPSMNKRPAMDAVFDLLR